MPTRKLTLATLLLLLLAALAYALWPSNTSAPGSGGSLRTGVTDATASQAADPARSQAAAAGETGPGELQRTVLPPTASDAPTYTVAGRVLAIGNMPVTGIRILAYAGEASDREGVMQGSFAAMADRGKGTSGPSFVVRGEPLTSAEVDSTGRFTLLAAMPHLRLTLQHDFYMLPLPVIVHVPTSTARTEIVLEPLLGGLLRGQILGEGRRDGMQVRLSADADPTMAMRDVQTYMAALLQAERPPSAADADGRFVFRGVLPGAAMQLQLVDSEFAARAATPPLQPGEVREVALPLQRAGSLRVHVADADGKPLAKVRIGVEPGDVQNQIARLSAVPSQNTGDDGVAVFHGLRPGPFDVTARGAGFVGKRAPTQVTSAAEAELHLQLEPGEAVAGVVVDQDGKPVEGARVAHFPSTEIPVLGDVSTSMGEDVVISAAENSDCRTDADGRFDLGGIDDDGKFLVVAWHPDHAGGLARGVQAGDRDVRIELREPASIHGRVVADESDEGLANFEVEAAVSVFLGLSRPARRQGFTDADDGAFVLQGLSPGDYQLHVRAEGRGEETKKVTLQSGAAVDVGTLRLCRAATVAGTVRDRDGVPVPGATVRQQKGGMLDNPMLASMFGSGSSARTDDRGAFTLRDLTPGKMTLMADALGYASTRSERFSIAAGETKQDVELVLGHGGSIDGQLLVGPGEHAEDWQLFAKDQKTGGSAFATVAPGGSFRITDLDPGRYDVQAMHPAATAAIQHQTQSFEPGKGIDLGSLMSAISENTVSTRCVVRDGETTQVTLDGSDLGSGGRLELHVELGQAPLSSGLAELTLLGDGRVQNGFVDHGVVEFGGLQPGPMQVQLRAGIGFTPLGAPTQLEYPRGTDRHVATIHLDGGELRGSVVDAESGEPLANVMVRLVHEDAPERDDQLGFAMTDNRGAFAFRALQPGSYALMASNTLQPGAASASTLSGLRLEAGEVRDQLVLRSRPAASVSVRVTDLAGQPLGGGMLLCVDANGRPFGSMSLTFTGPDGRAVLGGLPAGTARFVGRAPGFAPGVTALQTITAEQSAEFVLTLPRGPRVQAQVLDSNGAPLPGAEVMARCGEGPWFPALLLVEGHNPDGSFDLGRLQPGRWQFRVSHPRTGPFTVERSLADGSAATLLLTPP